MTVWTAEKEAALVADYGVISHRQIAKLYGMGHTTITTKAKELGLVSHLTPSGSLFTPEMDARLTELWGMKRAKEIGEELGKTRNAIIGRAHRLGLRNIRPEPKPKLPRAPRIRGEVKARKSPTLKFLSPPVPVEPLNILFGDLQERHCREVVGKDGFQSLSCGHSRIEDSSYCRWHHAINHTTPTPRARPYFPMGGR